MAHITLVCNITTSKGNDPLNNGEGHVFCLTENHESVGEKKLLNT